MGNVMIEKNLYFMNEVSVQASYKKKHDLALLCMLIHVNIIQDEVGVQQWQKSSQPK